MIGNFRKEGRERNDRETVEDGEERGHSSVKKIANLTEGPVLKTLLGFAIPIVLGNMIQQLYGMVDLMVIGHFGGNSGTVGISTGTQLTNFFTGIGTSLAAAGQIYVAQLAGADDRKKIKDAISTLFVMLLVSAVVVMGVLLFFGSELMILIKCPGEAVEQALLYLWIAVAGIPFVFGYNTVCGILRGLGESKRPLFFVLVAAVVNIFLDLLLVVGFHMGTAGTAIATVASQIGAFTASFLYFRRRMERMKLKLTKQFLFIDREALRVILLLAIPACIQYTCVLLSQLWCNARINEYGLTASATNSIGMNLHQMANLFMQGVSTAAGAMIGQNLGARQQERAKKVVGYSIASCVVLCMIVSSFCLLIPRQMYSFFTTDLEVMEFGVVYLRITVVAFVLAAFLGPLQALVTGSGFALMNFCIGILDGVICRVGFSLLFVHIFEMGAVSYFWGTALARVLPVIACALYFYSGKWRWRKLLSQGVQRDNIV